PVAPHPTPAILVHGFFGDPTNFLVLRGHLAAAGLPNFATFAYPPRIDYQRLAHRLGQEIELFRAETGAAEGDLIGHSLGGLVARYLVEMNQGSPVRRLGTPRGPYFASPPPRPRLAIFGPPRIFLPPPPPP